MKCQAVRRLLSPYLDSELLGQEAFAVARHMEQCLECAHRFEAEERLERVLVEAIAPGVPLPHALRRRLLAARRHRTALLLAAVAALAASFLTLWLWHDRPFTRIQEGPFAAALLRIHGNVLAGTELPHAVVDDQLEVRQFFEHKLGLPVVWPPWLDMRGIRLCALGGKPLALLFAQDGGREISVFAGSRDLLDAFPDEYEELSRTRRLLGDSGTFRVAISLREDLVLAAVGAVETSLLERILEDAR